MRGRALIRLPSDGPPRAPEVSARPSAAKAAVRFSVFAISRDLPLAMMHPMARETHRRIDDPDHCLPIGVTF
ncbi:hypothetical protein GCM10027280_10980 [Micromonospora polyrhachis]